MSKKLMYSIIFILMCAIFCVSVIWYVLSQQQNIQDNNVPNISNEALQTQLSEDAVKYLQNYDIMKSVNLLKYKDDDTYRGSYYNKGEYTEFTFDQNISYFKERIAEINNVKIPTFSLANESDKALFDMVEDIKNYQNKMIKILNQEIETLESLKSPTKSSNVVPPTYYRSEFIQDDIKIHAGIGKIRELLSISKDGDMSYLISQ